MPRAAQCDALAAAYAFFGGPNEILCVECQRVEFVPASMRDQSVRG
jgi:hypothetical protein